MDILTEIDQLHNLLYDFSKRNSFVHCRVSALWFLKDESQHTLKKIYKKARFYQNEYGLDAALQVDYFLAWVPPGKLLSEENQLVSPLYYKTCEVIIQRKVSESYRVDLTSEIYSINPIIKHYFSEFYQFDFLDSTENPEIELKRFADYFSEKNKPGVRFEKEFESITAKEWFVVHKPSVGVFNYKKSTLGEDFKQIKVNPNRSVLQLLDGGNKELEAGKLIPALISDVDQSQLGALTAALNGNVSIQGPPGTGKSHLIVALIGAFLAADKKILFVSEKRSALDVVSSRLRDLGLEDCLAYFDTSNYQKKGFYSNLKSAWEKRAEFSTEEVVLPRLDKGDLVDYYIQELRKYRASIDGDLWSLVERLLVLGFDTEEFNYTGTIPDYKNWRVAVSVLHSIENKLKSAFRFNHLQDASFVGLSSEVLREKEPLVKLEKRILDLRHVLQESLEVVATFKLGEISFDKLVKLALTASILSMVDKVQINLLDESSKSYKSFNSWSKKYDLLKARLYQAEKANEKWTKKPSMAEVNELMDLVSNDRPRGSGIFSRLKRNSNRWKDVFHDFHPSIGNHTKIKLLESLKLEWRLRGEFEELIVKLKHNFRITNPDVEIEQIFQLRNKLQAVSHNEYLQILEHSESRELIGRLNKLHPSLVQFNSQKRFMFNDKEVVSIAAFDKELEKLFLDLPLISKWFPELRRFFEIDKESRKFVRLNEMTVEKMDAVVLHHTILKESRFEKDFNALSSWELMQNLRANILNQKAEQKFVLGTILEKRKAHYKRKEAVLEKPGFKLKDFERTDKKKYKAEKRVLLHEMNKKQQHLPVKKCFEVAKDTLLDIHPVWLMNPLSVSENLPCIADMFDVVVFDESSQIPLEDAIPSVYRSKQVVVVGDEEQMPPSSFFASSGSVKTILHKSKEMYPFRMLRWHYRSKHPGLIQFSNQNFYNNELVCFPPHNSNAPIHFHKVDGVYFDGKNIIEAKEIAKLCFELSTKERENAIVIAFSKEQEGEIQRQLAKFGVNDSIRTRNLENAQGIEADIILVSVGYARNQEGAFRLNFGPVNQVSGANRLNVLFTRAIEKMVLVSSVGSIDFPLSENRGVSMLKDFLQFAESQIVKVDRGGMNSYVFDLVVKRLEGENIEFEKYYTVDGMVLNCVVNHNSNRVILVDPCLGENEVIDLVTVYNRLSTDFDKVKIVLSLDFLQNRTRIEEELLSFFGE